MDLRVFWFCYKELRKVTLWTYEFVLTTLYIPAGCHWIHVSDLHFCPVELGPFSQHLEQLLGTLYALVSP